MKRNIVPVIVIGLLASAWMYYLHWNNERVKNGPKRQHINCVNNLKQIGLAFLIWNGDHSNQFPFNISTNAGGTLELCARDKDGFDSNAYLFIQAMSNELTTTKLLICPLDHSKSVAANWASVTASNITYRFRSGTDVNFGSSHQVLAVCPIDGNILYANGTVESKEPIERDDSGHYPMSVTTHQ